MTCEVAVLNKSAIVLAADSAVTFTSESGEPRYSKGGNKIFQLSHHAPIGIMIYGSAMLGGIPWEVLTKAFRDEHLTATRLSTVDDYARAFLAYLSSGCAPLSAKVKMEIYASYFLAAQFAILNRLNDEAPIAADETRCQADRASAAALFLSGLVRELEGEPLDNSLSPCKYDALKKNPPAQALRVAKELLAYQRLDTIVDARMLANAMVAYLHRRYGEQQPSTGLVFAGYGEKEYFPSMHAYEVGGLVADELVFREGTKSHVSLERPADLKQFAMTSQVEAFTLGVADDTFSAVKQAFTTYANKVARDVLENANEALPEGTDALIAKTRDEFMDDWSYKVMRAHYAPLKRVISTLSVEEMAHLAETLIVVQSLKEKMTTSRQTVGGPVDVVAITRSEGLVWLKRKHYFDTGSNLGFVFRQSMIHQ